MQSGIMSFIGSGDLYMDRLTSAGVSTGFQLVGNATKLEVKVEAEQKEQLSNGRDTYGQTLASVTRITGTTIGLTLNQLNHQMLAAIFLGNSVAMTGAGGSITSEAVTAREGKWVELAHKGVSSVVVKDVTDTTTYVSGTDYNVNTRLGMIEILAAGAIADAAVLHVSYTWAAESGYRITGATQPSVKVALRLDGKNDYDGSDVDVRIWEAQLTPNSPVDFLAEDWNELQFEGKLVTPTGRSWPFEVI